MPSRRSGRLSGVRKTYTFDPLADEDPDSNNPEETSQSKGKRPVRKDDDESDEEFQGQEEEEEDDEDEVFEDEDAGAGNGVEVEDADEPVPSAGEEETKGRRRKGPRKPAASRSAQLDLPRTTKSRLPDGTIALTGEETHSRGNWNPLEHVGKSIHLQVTFGLDERDLLAVLYTRDRWSRGTDSTFPTRVSLDEAGTLRDYKYGSTFGIELENMERERTSGWDWYYDDESKGRFRKRLRLEKITEEEARETFLPKSKQGKHTVLMGPSDNQVEFNLGQYDILNFGDAWGQLKGQKKSKTAEDEARSKKKRQGWILNIGQRIQCIAWTPNQNGLDQYLAVVAPVSPEQKETVPDPLEDYAAPAFRSSAPYPCALQIWAFRASKEGKVTKSIDMSFQPCLRLVLGTKWGDLRRMVWCHIPREPRDEDEEGGYKSLGLLAGIWGDGYVRVLDIKVSKDPNSTEFYKVGVPVFEAKPPSTVCTCVAWLSSSDISVGCANGFVAVWSIAPPSNRPQPEPANLPYLYHPVHSTYILNISPAYPTHAHLVATTSMDGETRLSSVLDWNKDVVDTTRMRVGSPHLAYSPWLHSFVSSDENDFVRLLTVRRFFTTISIARLQSTISALAPCSPCHPSILFGSTGGSVIATNPLRRLLHSKEKQWQQTWFTHTWARGNDSNSNASGTSRFYDGFRADSISLMRNMTGDRKMVNGTLMVTIYEEETHVTALAWNSNQSCAGWAAAGLGCGLLRVEDLAL
ncbi:transcription factor TFIIIC subunit TFC6 [Aspergillus undulatus]|uniref:transcription factor TFIIIC subunit TFC6 n=1 Tax=Aspergillus undulatus TaxID=1810928 RepID=UPI003CCCFE91